MTYNRIFKRLWLLLILSVVAGVLLSSSETKAAGSPVQSAPETALPPTTVTTDAEGYTLWTVDWRPWAWCVPYSRIAYPFDLGTYDPTAFSDASLILTYNQGVYDPLGYSDPTWTVALNGAPPDEWRGIGTFNGPVINPETWPTAGRSSVSIPFDVSELIDGQNKVWLRQHDFCPTELLEDGACTCVEIHTVQLRAGTKLGVRSVSPAPDTRNVWPEQSANSEIRVRFTTPVSATTVNADTFQVYYFDENVNKVYAAGDVKRLSDAEYAFVPTTALLPGVQYIAQVWGENDASAHSHEAWVQDLSGGPLEEGKLWVFWTLPDLQVTVKPVQVLEGMALVAHKPTVLRAFIHWDAPEGVFWKSVAPDMMVEDVTLTWLAPGDTVWNQARWSDGVQWRPALTADTVRHKREYREFTFKEESYDLREKRLLLDSFNYFGFTPRETGVYNFEFAVWVKDSQGRNHPFRGYASTMSAAENVFPIYMRAVGVGPDYGKTGTVDLSTLIRYNLRGMRALYPVPDVKWPNAPSAMAYYTPTTTGLLVDWTVRPWAPYYSEELYLLREMHALCVRTPGCWAMVGLVHKDWLNTPGNTQRESAPTGALVRNDSDNAGKRYVTAHEVGHLAHIDAHYEGPSGSGFDVIERSVKNAEQGYTDFMTAMPEEIGDVALWITGQHYVVIQQWIMDHYNAQAQQLTQPTFAQSADPLLLVDGVISPTTGAVTLLPWYQIDAGDYVPPLPGPYELVFLDAAQQEIVGYTQSFTVNTTLRYAGAALTADDGPATFTFAAPYPTATAKVQIRRSADATVLAEITPAADPPTVTIQAPSGVWRGPQTLTWQTSASAHYFAVDISTDNGATWEAYALNLTTPAYTLETIALPNTTGALIRVAASDGLRTATAIAGPFTIDNPPLVGYVDPPDGADNADVWTPPQAGFRDPMNPTSIHSATFTLNGGPFGAVTGVISYNTTTREATFTPAVPLAYATRYTATLTTGILGVNGDNLPLAHTWTFTTEIDTSPPSPILVSPQDGTTNIPRNVVLAANWDRDLNSSTVTTNTFRLATATGTPVSGTVTYDAAARTATFAPAAALLTDTLYIATLKGGIASTGGYTTTGDFNWAFTTGNTLGDALAFTGSYADWGQDTNGDGLYEHLVIRVGVQTARSGTFALQGILADAAGADVGGAEIDWTETVADLQPGVHFFELVFDGVAIGGRGVDGPYTLSRLTLSAPDESVWAVDAYHTFAYRAAQFPAPLRFGGLPDLLVRPGLSLDPAFSVYAYASHVTQTSASLAYTLLANTNPRVGVTLGNDGIIRVNPEPGWGGEVWTGSTLVTLQAAYGSDRVQDTFQVTVGWFANLYLPVTLRNFSPSSAQLTRSYWQTAFTDNFEQETLLWRRWSSYSAYPVRYYQWGRRDCGAYSGQYSAWPFGDGDDGALLSCGAEYPAGLSESTMMRGPFNLQYTTQAEFRVKVWTDLAPGDEVCAMVTNWDLGEDNMWQAHYDGVCRTGQTAGWEDLVLDLANVPTFGNLLGQEKVWVAVRFRSPQGATATRPVGAYVDDAVLRLCPLGLGCETTMAAGEPTDSDIQSTSPTGIIGGYDEEVGEVALAREANGRVHALWTGRLNPHFAQFVFYATSADGVNWTPLQILSYAEGYDPQIAVDDTRQLVHLMYRADGIIHHVVENGVVSPPLVVDNTLESRFGLTTGPTSPRVTVAPGTGHVHAVWRQAHFTYINATTMAGRFRTWYAYWNGQTWSERQWVINDDDTWDSTLTADTDGGVMLAWFQRWQQSQEGAGAGEPTIPRTAYGLAAALGSFPLRQGVSGVYDVPQTDASILLTYSPGDGKYYMASRHMMWPGHSRVYRYVWADGVWSTFLDVAGNASGWGIPVYVGAATNTPLVRYIYKDNDVLKMRTETAGVLGPIQTVASYLTARGYTGSPVAYFTDAAGDLHMIVSGEKDSVPGFYYVQP
jgi:hypothetical protein